VKDRGASKTGLGTGDTPLSGDPVDSPGAPVELDEFEPEVFDPAVQNGGDDITSSLSVLHDVDLVVTAELGRTTMPVRELLALTPGMVIEIDRAAGAPIDLLVNGRRIAAGEVVVIDEEFGIRITEIAPIGERTR
jgi:flagellar motor switch protein FliN/FliY